MELYPFAYFYSPAVELFTFSVHTKLACSLLCTEYGYVLGIKFDEYAETYSILIDIEQCILIINVQAMMVHCIPQI